MKNDVHFWIAILLRGALALIVGSAVLVIPDMASTLLLMPFAVAVSILCLAAYGVLDSSIIFVCSFMVLSPSPRIALRLQGTCGVLVGLILFFVIYNRFSLHWFLYLIAFQAFCTAVAEAIVARHAFTRTISHWNYAAAGVALLFLIAYSVAAAVFGERLSSRDVAWLIFGYLVAFGMAQCLTAARMLYADYQIVELEQAGVL
jgi:hypothetical protein